MACMLTMHIMYFYVLLRVNFVTSSRSMNGMTLACPSSASSRFAGVYARCILKTGHPRAGIMADAVCIVCSPVAYEATTYRCTD